MLNYKTYNLTWGRKKLNCMHAKRHMTYRATPAPTLDSPTTFPSCLSLSIALCWNPVNQPQRPSLCSQVMQHPWLFSVYWLADRQRGTNKSWRCGHGGLRDFHYGIHQQVCRWYLHHQNNHCPPQPETLAECRDLLSAEYLRHCIQVWWCTWNQSSKKNPHYRYKVDQS